MKIFTKLIPAALLSLAIISSVGHADDQQTPASTTNPFDWFAAFSGDAEVQTGATMEFHPIKPESWMKFVSPGTHVQWHMAFSNPANYAQFMQPQFYAEFMNPQNWMAWMNPAVYMQFMNPQVMTYWMNPAAFSHAMDPAMYSQLFNMGSYMSLMDPKNFSGWANPETYANMMNPDFFTAYVAPQSEDKAE